MESRIQGCLGFPHMGLLPLVLRLTAMNSDGSRGEARRAGPPYFYFSFLRPLPPLSEGLDPPLMKVTPKIPILPNSKLNGNHMLILRRFSVVSNSARDANGLFKVLLLSSHLLNSWQVHPVRKSIEVWYMRSNGILLHLLTWPFAVDF